MPARKSQLDPYHAKRDFKRTKEPAGKVGQAKKQKLTYMIQKHAASHLHFDFRLEWDGVLKSWAVAKGPSADPAQKRLAVQVEDHPLEYATFEGTIPKGQYGGGTVMLWDRGTWEPIGDVEKSLQKGRLTLKLHGERLQGEWHLVRMGGKAAGDRRQNWLLIKSHDEFADEENLNALVEDYTTSVRTGRSMEAIADGNSSVWTSKGEKKPKAALAKKSGVKSAMPDFIPPQLATLVEHPPSGAGWVHEIKFDGYRALVRIGGKTVKMLTRANNDWTQNFLNLPQHFKKLGLQSALIDGEVVVPDKAGRTSFHALQNILGRFGNRKNPSDELHYYAFDLLYLNGEDIMHLPLKDRKSLLREIIPVDHVVLHFSDDVSAAGDQVLQKACSLKLEGIVSKRLDSSYQPGRGMDWQKSKCIKEQEMVIGGFVEQAKHPGRLGALLIGYYQEGKLVLAGKVGTGFTQAEGKNLLAQLEALQSKVNPFGTVAASYRRSAQWIEPRLVARIAFTEWTPDGMMRHPSFQGLREDKPAQQVQREEEQPKKKIRKSSPSELIVQGVTITHPDKILYPDAGITKAELVDYYARTGEFMLPYIKGFPLSLVRCPDGQGKECFFQRHSDISSPYIKKIPIRLEHEHRDFIMIESTAGLIALVQMGVLEIHAWGARGKTPDKPERIVFDFDPDERLPFSKVKDAALDIRARLKKLGMESFLKTTGGKGLHVVLPFQTGPSWEEVRAFSEAMAGLMAEDAPELYTVNSRKATRQGKIYIDYLRNNKSASAIAPFSTRARPGAPIALPLAWSDLNNLKHTHDFTIQDFPKNYKNPWKNMLPLHQKLRIKS